MQTRFKKGAKVFDIVITAVAGMLTVMGVSIAKVRKAHREATNEIKETHKENVELRRELKETIKENKELKQSLKKITARMEHMYYIEEKEK